MKKIISLCFLISLTVSIHARQFDRVAIFGDSLSDMGNMYKYSWHFIPKSPPYYKGHFSNRQVWPEYLLERYFGPDSRKRLSNYAVGGSGAVLTKEENLPYTLATEMAVYLNADKHQQLESILHVVWSGSNNYLNGPENVDEVTTYVVDEGVMFNVKALIDNGAKMIVVGNLPDISTTPEASHAKNRELLATLIREHNNKLKHRVDEMKDALKQQGSDVVLVYFDVAKTFSYIQTHPEEFGITNTTEACYNGGYWLMPFAAPTNKTLQSYLREQRGAKGQRLSEQQIRGVMNNPELRLVVSNDYYALVHGFNAQDTLCEGNMFWDQIHPTTKMHELIASYMASAIADAGLSPTS